MGRRLILLSVIVSMLTTASSSPAQVNGKNRSKADELVCQKIEQTGSRLAVKRVCMTRSQWSERKLQDRQAIEKMQTLQSVKGD